MTKLKFVATEHFDTCLYSQNGNQYSSNGFQVLFDTADVSWQLRRFQESVYINEHLHWMGLRYKNQEVMT
jgi:hypothetical protein